MSDPLLEMVTRAQQGNRSAFRALFERMYPSVVRYCTLLAGDSTQAQDLAQDVFTRVFRSLPGLDDPSRFESWLFAIVRNVCRTRGAQAQRRQLLAAELELALAEPDDRLDEEHRQERIAVVQKILAKVEDPILREIIQWKYGEPERTTREIAGALGIPHGTVTVKLMRFRTAVRQELARALAELNGGSSP